MSIISKLNTPFFLTGGTALSRHYYNHRYSDDLDLFVLSDSDYHDYIDSILKTLLNPEKENQFIVDKGKIKRFKDYTQIYIISKSGTELQLKIDLINDVAAHFGTFESDKTLGKIDGWRNILSNKICALFRFEPKDIADIWIIASRNKFQWKEILTEAKQKELGVEPDVICNILKSFPIEQLNIIKWVVVPDFDKIKNDIDKIADDIFFGVSNSLISG